MITDSKLLVGAAVSVAAHFALARGLAHLPKYVEPPVTETITLRVVSPPPAEPAKTPEPEPAKAPEPKPVEPTPQVHERPRAHPVEAVAHAPAPKDVPPLDQTPTPGETTDTPVFGVSMESTSQMGGPAMPVGNTTRAQPGTSPTQAAAKPLAAPVAAYEATKMPLPQGRCFGKYTDEARQAGVEGTVVLDLIVGEDGRTRDIQVVAGLPNGLTEAAVAALRECRFAPGEQDGKPVAVRVRGFKIRFVLQNDE